jgi:putative transposase
MMFPLVLELAADRIPVAVTCRVLGFSKQAFFKWRKNPVSQRDWDNAHLINAAVDIHADDPAFGYRFIADEVEAVSGIAASERRVWKLCNQQRIWSTFAKKRGLNRKAGPPVHDDLVTRQFSASRANELWLTDITEHWTDEGKLYLCAIKDVFSNRIVGYSIDDRMTASLAVAAVRNAVTLRSPAGTIIHSDRGSQFRSRKFVETLRHAGLTGSMGRVGACGDNAAMESFFALLQKNVLNKRRWQTREQLRLEIVTWIEKTYHRRRRQRALGRLTPIEYETVNWAAHAA